MKHFTIACLVAMLTVGLLSCDQDSKVARDDTPSQPGTAGTEEVALVVTGMDCSHGCAPRVEKALLKVPGVRTVKVSFANKEALLLVEKGKFDPQAARDALQAEDKKFSCDPKP